MQRFVEHNFREGPWEEGLVRFDAVLTMQAGHELRHKRHAFNLHKRVKEIPVSGGSYLVCAHFAGEGVMADNQLCLSRPEQRAALEKGGFSCIRKCS